MAKRIQVQGPNVRTLQTKVNAPIVDTYFRPEQEANKYAELSTFLNKVVPQATQLALDVRTKKIKKDVDLLGEISYSQKDWGVFEEFIKEKGITNSHATYTAFNARKGMEDGKSAKESLNKFYLDNSAEWMSQPDSTMQKEAVNNWLQENFPQGKEAETGYLSEYTKVLQNHNNHLDQNFTQAHTTLIKKDTENGLVENISGMFANNEDGQTITDTTQFFADTGIIPDSAYGRLLIQQGVIRAIQEDSAANGGMNIKAMTAKWANLTTSTGAKLSAVKGSNELVQAAINTALARVDQEENRKERGEDRIKREQGAEITNLVFEGREVDPDDYDLTAFEFNAAVTKGENSKDSRKVSNETTPEVYQSYEIMFADVTGGMGGMEALRDRLLEENGTLAGDNLVKAAFLNATLSTKDQVLTDIKDGITAKYKLKLGQNGGSGTGNTWLPTIPADAVAMKAEQQRAEQAWLTYKAEKKASRFYSDEDMTVKKSPEQIAADDAAWFADPDTRARFELDAEVPSLQPNESFIDNGNGTINVNNVIVTVTKDDDSKADATVSKVVQSTEDETKPEVVEEPEVVEPEVVEPEVVEPEVVEEPELTREEKEEAIKQDLADLTNNASEAVSSWWNSAVQQDGMKSYVKKQTRLIKSRSERKRINELLSQMTLEQQVAYFAANEVATSD